MNRHILIFISLLSIQFQKVFPSEVTENKIEHSLLTKAGKTTQNSSANCNILIWGGGYSPSGNQVSLESNVRYFLRVRDKMGLTGFQTRILFADGSDNARDIQFRDPKFLVPETNLLLAEMFGSTRGIYNQYRNNNLEANGSSSIGELDKWFNDVNCSPSDSLNMIYFTGHGGKGDKKEPFNTTAHLWNNQKVKVSDLAKKLDLLPMSQSVILIMVQCYSGGFANFIFKDGNPKKELHQQPRAGFFATTHDRVAAGCTPDIREANYQEYSTKFWEALCGESRVGNQITKPDFNGDGRTSLSEAHAYVIINSKTIDIPIKTSDIFLRKYSELNSTSDRKGSFNRSKKENIKSEDQILSSTIDSNRSSVDEKLPLMITSPISKILRYASHESNATIRALSEKLVLEDEKRFEQTNRKIDELKKKREELAKTKKQKEGQCKDLKNKIKERLRVQWPELANIHHPIVDQLKKDVLPIKLLSLANKNNQWQNFKGLKKEISSIENQRFLIEKNQVLAMRLKNEIENVVLEQNLLKSKRVQVIERFLQLKSLERVTLDQLSGRK